MSLYWHDYLMAFGFMFSFTGLGFWLGWMVRG